MSTRWAWARRAGTLAAAILLVAFTSLMLASAASAQALPESPFYAVKRAEETVLLSISWGDESRGQTLNMIANHRLVEASSEADQRRITEAHALMGQFDATFGQLIDLAAHTQTRHDDTTTYTNAIQATLAAEQVAATRAAAHGEPGFARTIDTSVQTAATHIQAVDLSIPALPSAGDNGKGQGKGKGQGNGQGNGSSHSQQTPSPQTTPSPEATHTPHATTGSGQGNSVSNNGEMGSQTPVPTTTPGG